MYRMKEKLQIAAVVFCVLFMAGCGKEESEVVELEEVQLSRESEIETAETTEEVQKIYVFVCGQVNCPGVYELEAGDRVYEAVLKAGGMLETAAKEYVNQAAVLEDGQKVYIPSIDEVSQNAMTGGDESGIADGKVNINTAGKEELMTLTGIGETRAEAILRYREENSGFKSLEELMQVEGIKQGTYDKLKDQITI